MKEEEKKKHEADLLVDAITNEVSVQLKKSWFDLTDSERREIEEGMVKIILPWYVERLREARDYFFKWAYHQRGCPASPAAKKKQPSPFDCICGLTQAIEERKKWTEKTVA